MRCPLAQYTPDPDLSRLRKPLKPGPKITAKTPRTKEERLARQRGYGERSRKRKKEAAETAEARIAAAEARAKKAEGDLAEAKEANRLQGLTVVRAAMEIRRLRAVIASMEADAIVAEVEAAAPDADLHGEGTVV